jgi:transcriptional regulator with XRE-family HTH domain
MPEPEAQTPGSDRAEAVGAIIRRRRQALGLTLRAFARQCDISPAHLSKVERGLANPSLAMLTRIVQELDLHGTDLFGLAPEAETGARVVRADVLAAGSRPLLPQRTSERQVIAIVLEGAIEAQVGDEVFTLGEGDTLIVPPHTAHAIRATGGPETRAVYISSDADAPA